MTSTKTLTLVERLADIIATTEFSPSDEEAINRAISLLEAAEKALEPFAEKAATYSADSPLAGSDISTVFVSDLRLARSVYQKIKGEG